MDLLADEPARAAVPRPARRWSVVLVYSCAIFLGAFLQFLIQPLVGNAILPWFGGSAAVWGVCLVFFQALLLLGYVYAHLLTQRLRFNQQLIVHGGLLLVAIVFLRVIPDSTRRPPSVGHPVPDILVTLATTVGLPYALLSATSPLLQAWLARSRSEYPYRLYALSNLGSMIGLLGYPFAVQPALGLQSQAYFWTVGFILFAVLCALAALVVCSSLDPRLPVSTSAARVSLGRFLTWAFLAAFPSAMLVAATNVLCMDVASTPFLWVVPLAIYLLSLIVCFASPIIYERKAFGAISLCLLFMTAWTQNEKTLELPVVQQLVLFTGCLFAVCMMFHGELVRRRPETQHLTHFYLSMAFGGVLGGAAVAIAAPLVFHSYLEFPIIAGISAAFAAAAVTGLFGKEQRPLPAFRARARKTEEEEPQPYWWSLRIAAAVVLVAAFIFVLGGLSASTAGSTTQVVGRDFYGVVSVEEEHLTDPARHAMVMWHGSIRHGMQMLSPKLRRVPQLYFHPTSGVGKVIEVARKTRPHLRVGIIGLGTGSLAGYGESGDVYKFYEISPLVVQTAMDYFTFVKDCPAKVEVVLGDARISLDRELPQEFDLFVCDAFSSDSIPLHLLTREAFAVYLRHLKPNGVMAFHITNSHVDLAGPLHALAAEAGLSEVVAQTERDPTQGVVASTWYVLTRDRNLVDALKQQFPDQPPLANWTTPWTDDRCDLFSVLK